MNGHELLAFLQELTSKQLSADVWVDIHEWEPLRDIKYMDGDDGDEPVILIGVEGVD